VITQMHADTVATVVLTKCKGHTVHLDGDTLFLPCSSKYCDQPKINIMHPSTC